MNEIIHRKLISNPLPNSFQNPFSRRGENRRGPDGKFAQKPSPPTEEDTDEEPEEIEETEEQDPSTPNSSIDTLDDSFDFAAPIQIGRGRTKQPKSTKTNTPEKKPQNACREHEWKNNCNKQRKQ